jgi:hypothetical protein
MKSHTTQLNALQQPSFTIDASTGKLQLLAWSCHCLDSSNRRRQKRLLLWRPYNRNLVVHILSQPLKLKSANMRQGVLHGTLAALALMAGSCAGFNPLMLGANKILGLRSDSAHHFGSSQGFAGPATCGRAHSFARRIPASDSSFRPTYQGAKGFCRTALWMKQGDELKGREQFEDDDEDLLTDTESGTNWENLNKIFVLLFNPRSDNEGICESCQTSSFLMLTVQLLEKILPFPAAELPPANVHSTYLAPVPSTLCCV